LSIAKIITDAFFKLLSAIVVAKSETTTAVPSSIHSVISLIVDDKVLLPKCPMRMS
jgi:hypothetical protein